MFRLSRFLIISMALSICSDLCLAGEESVRIDSRGKDALTAIHARKSVRNYTGRAVSREDLLTLCKAAMAAPTSMDKRPWAFVVVTDKNILAALAEELPYTKMLESAGSAIVVCGVLDKAIIGEGKEFWIQDCSAASENILLAAEAMNLGAVWSGMYPLKERVAHVRKVLGIPENVVPLNVIAVGYPVGTEKAKDKFDPANIHWGKW